MQRFRSTWLALMGGALLVTLSISAAFGADPATTRNATRGQTIAALVHELIFGAEDAPEEDAELEEEEVNEDDPDALQEPEELDEGIDEVTVRAGAHGECVSEVARDPEAIGGTNENHGGAVSEAARETCEDEAQEEALDDEGGAEVDETAVESDKEVARAAREAARAAHDGGKPAWAGTGGNSGNAKAAGNGNGRGRGRP